MLNDKNNSNFTKNSKILIGLAAILAALYVLSFTKSCTSKDKRDSINTSLVNQKYKDLITSFEFSDKAGFTEIKKCRNFWTIQNKNEAETSQLILPASDERIKNLIENLTKIRKLYKISDKISQNNSFGLTNGTEFHLRYYTENTFHELIFGNQDFSLSSRYMMTEKNTQVYEIDSSLDTYLTTSIQNWTEPFIISQSVLGKIKPEDVQRSIVFSGNHQGSISDIQKLLDLRHGGFPSLQDADDFINHQKKTEIIINLELGNKNEIDLYIYKSSNENQFIIFSEYKNQKEEKPFFISTSKISSWTYNKIKEITL